MLVGYYERARVGPLVYAGRVGSGLDDAARAALASQLVVRSTSPFVGTPKLDGAVWVEPDAVAEVEFSEWTDDGVLRQPVFRGLRVDKDPADVVRDPERASVPTRMPGVRRAAGGQASRRDSFQLRNRVWRTPSGPSPSPAPSGCSRNV